ncbi:helix-hairpin-helix domain-containing protein [Micromonospora sp. DT31]|uniref:helix-hairpin-helix domain-containing protein n=1 Tax=Micromonospora sp. DT31 TaxID=3393434 RepID=UPI003CF50204
MPDDRETMVRRRLARLFLPAGQVAAEPQADRAARVRPGPAFPLPQPRHDLSEPAPELRSGFPAPGPGLPSGLAEPEPRAGASVPWPDPDDPWATDRVFAAYPGEVAEVDPPDDVEVARGPASRLPGPGAFDPGRRGVRALAAVALVVVLVAAVWAWRSRPRAEPVGPVASGIEAATGGVPVAPAPSGSSGQVVVAVAGKVRRPGLVRLPAGARLADAVEAAGGALPGVDVALLNPARKVTDGELILVGVTAAPGQNGPGAAAGAGQPGGPSAPAGPVNLNTATLAQLDALPGVGPVLAQRILDHRDRQGGFRSVADLRQVDGIGDARYEQLKELVTV